LAPTLGGRPPTPTGAARLLDWVGVPLVACALPLLDGRRKRALAWSAGAVFLLSCAMAGLQHFGIWPAEETMARLAWTRIPYQRVYETVPGDGTRFMAGGLLFHRLKFANIGGLCVLWALGLGLRARGTARVAGVMVAVVGFLSELVFPYARAASVALLASAGALLLLQLRHRLHAVAVGAALALVAAGTVAASPSLRQRFLSSNTGEGSGDRPYFLAAGVNAVKAHPLAGFGPGRFRPALFAPPGSPDHVLEHRGKSHNQFLSLAAEIGLPGVALFVLLLGWLWRRLRASAAAEAGRACLIFFVLVSLLHDPLYHAESSLAVVFALGLALGAGRSASEPRAG
ncbi:MAG TPA: O-antigen ligase family protein, partial [Myxococcaceae bacterium]|nr:O-antigen ligase family protein [Myxococcaceae bacterium]